MVDDFSLAKTAVLIRCSSPAISRSKKADQAGGQDRRTTRLRSQLRQVATRPKGRSVEQPHYLAAIVDPAGTGPNATPIGRGSNGPGGDKRSKDTASIDKAIVSRRVRETAHDLAAVVDPISRGANGSRNVYCCDGAAGIEKAMDSRRVVTESSHNLAAIVDPIRGPGKVDRSEDPVTIQEVTPSYPRPTIEISHNLAVVVDRISIGVNSSGNIDGVEDAVTIEKAGKGARVFHLPHESHDLAAVVDPCGRRFLAILNIGEGAIVEIATAAGDITSHDLAAGVDSISHRINLREGDCIEHIIRPGNLCATEKGDP